MNPDLQQMIRWEQYKYGSPILAAKEIDLEKNKAEIIFYGMAYYMFRSYYNESKSPVYPLQACLLLTTRCLVQSWKNL